MPILFKPINLLLGLKRFIFKTPKQVKEDQGRNKPKLEKYVRPRDAEKQRHKNFLSRNFGGSLGKFSKGAAATPAARRRRKSKAKSKAGIHGVVVIVPSRDSKAQRRVAYGGGVKQQIIHKYIGGAGAIQETLNEAMQEAADKGARVMSGGVGVDTGRLSNSYLEDAVQTFGIVVAPLGNNLFTEYHGYVWVDLVYSGVEYAEHHLRRSRSHLTSRAESVVRTILWSIPSDYALLVIIRTDLVDPGGGTSTYLDTEPVTVEVDPFQVFREIRKSDTGVRVQYATLVVPGRRSKSVGGLRIGSRGIITPKTGGRPSK